MSRELTILNKLRGSPHCVQLLDFFFTCDDILYSYDGKLFNNFVFEYIPDNLERRIDFMYSAG